MAVLTMMAGTISNTRTDSAGELLSRGCQRRTGCAIRFREAWVCEPGYAPYNMDRHRHQERLQRRVRQANGARPTSVKRAPAWGEGPCPAGPQRVVLLTRCRGLAVPRRLAGFMVDLGPDGARARFGCRAGTGGTHRTRPAVCVGQAQLVTSWPVTSRSGCPCRRCWPWGHGAVGGAQGRGTGARRLTGALPRRPARGGRHRPHAGHPRVRGTCDAGGGGGGAPGDPLVPWQPRVRGAGRMERRSPVVSGGRRGFWG
jgi:hypothetical protein